MSPRLLRVCNALGSTWNYQAALRTQENIASLVGHQGVPDTLLLLQHQPIYTVGKRGTEADFKVSKEELHGAEVETVPRGGETTFHGPGQLVCYPIVNLRRLKLGARAYVEGLEDTVIATLGQYGVEARGRVPGRTGVWVRERKIAAIGVQITHGVTRHGAALNVSTDLSYFDSIVPCGISDKEVTSLRRELQEGAPEIQEVADVFVKQFMQQLSFTSCEYTERDKLEE
ncbi:g5790 [Coccomyxa viridis]|uniref:lipoyl(octanoyl) transferase n=1 Tax=Coccomyxa viridis TaxID=1274662 RepID=A0ABP1FTS1_9CHLO